MKSLHQALVRKHVLEFQKMLAHFLQGDRSLVCCLQLLTLGVPLLEGDRAIRQEDSVRDGSLVELGFHWGFCQPMSPGCCLVEEGLEQVLPQRHLHRGG